MSKIGLIAGSGRFPLLFAEQARRQGLEVLALGIKGVTDPALEKTAAVEYFKLGQIDKPLAYLKGAGIQKAVMAGKVEHVSVFGGLMPDLRAVKLLARLKDKRTDTILAAVAEEFSKEGIELLPSSTFLAHLLAAPGPMTKRRPEPAQEADIRLGWSAAKAVASFDIGQTVVVSSGAVVAVEAMEGTDRTVERAAQLARSKGASPGLVVVKVAKPRQDLRYDLPVVGLDTLATLERCGGRVLALEAGKTLLFDKNEFLKQAEKQGLAVVGIQGT